MTGLKMSGLKIVIGTSAALVLLAGCDNGPSAVASKQAAGTQMASADAPARTGSADGPRVDHRKDPVPTIDGKAIWSASRRYSAEESAQRAFERNGDAFDARNIDQYVKKAHAFVE